MKGLCKELAWHFSGVDERILRAPKEVKLIVDWKWVWSEGEVSRMTQGVGLDD